MNKIYRIIWSKVLGTWVAVSERTNLKGKTAKSIAAIDGNSRSFACSKKAGALAIGLITYAAVLPLANAFSTSGTNYGGNSAGNWWYTTLYFNSGAQCNIQNSSSVTSGENTGYNYTFGAGLHDCFGALDNSLAATNNNLAVTNNNLTNTMNGLNSLTTNINNGTIGLVQQVGGPGAGAITVGAQTYGSVIDVTNAGGNWRTITGVSPGIQGGDAVNLNQLNNVQNTLQGNIDGVQTNLNTTNVTLSNTINNLNNLSTNINNGTIGLVQQVGGPGVGGVVTVGAQTDGTVMDVRNQGGVNRTITGAAPASLLKTSTEVVIGSQFNTGLGSVATNLGGGSVFDPATGTVSAPSYTVNGGTYDNVGSAIDAINQQTSGGTGIKYFRSNSTLQDVIVTGTDATAMGPHAQARGNNSIALGVNAQANNDRTISIGTGNIVNGARSGALGDPNTVNAADSYAIGNNNTIDATSAGSFVLGNNVNVGANLAGSVVLGNDSSISAPTPTAGTTINGKSYSYKGVNPTSAVSVGAFNAERQIQNVAAGRVLATSTDAVNGSQLYATNTAVEDLGTTIKNGTTGLVQQLGGSPGSGNITVGAQTGGTVIDFKGTSLNNGGARTLTGVRDGSLASGSTDAVTGNQLNNTNTQINNVYNTGVKYFHAQSTGLDSQAQGLNSVAIGSEAVASYADSVALGYKSVTAGTPPAGTGFVTGSVAPASEVSIGGAGYVRRLTNLAAGAIDTDAVNVGQLKAVTGQINTVIGQTVFNTTTGQPVAPEFVIQGTPYTNLTNALAGVNTSLTQNKTDITNVTNGLTGLVRQDPTTGLITIGGQTGGTVINVANSSGTTRTITGVSNGINPTDAATYGQVQAVDTRVTNITNNINNGAVGPVQYSSSATPTTPNGGTITNDVTLVGAAAGPVGLHNVADGSTAAGKKDAINGGQLNTALSSVATNLGGGSVYDPTTGTVTAPTYNITKVLPDGTTVNNTYTTVGGALSGLDHSLSTVSNTLYNITTGGAGVKYVHVNSAKADSQATGTDSVAVGPAAVASGSGSLAFGNGAASRAQDSLAMGSGSTADGAGAIALGVKSQSSGSNTVAIGSASQAGNGGVALGNNAKALMPLQGTALGNSATVTANNGVALGSMSVADRAGMNGIKEAVSNVVVNSTYGALSVGSQGNERQITNVAGGTQATDAVNLRQLQAVQSSGAQYATKTDSATGTTTINYSNLTLGNGQAPSGTVISNVGAGVNGKDAVNLDQLNALRKDASNAFEQISSDLNSVDKNASSGTAGAMAMAGLPQAYLPGKSMASLAVSGYRGQGALAVGLSTITDNGRWVYKVNASAASRGKIGATAGAGLSW